jgi:hypothetical protein
MARSVVVAIGAVMLTGCVSTKVTPLKESDVATLQGGKVTTTTRPVPGFVAMTAGKAMFGALGGAAMAIAGNNLVKENGVPDPADYIANELTKGFADANAMTVASNGNVVATAVKPADLAKQYADADLLLDVQTINWSFAYFPTDWNNYRVMYSARLRVIDVKKAAVLAEGFCSRVPENSDTAPSYDDLVNDGAAGLKKELLVAANYCIRELRSQVFLPNTVKSASTKP